MPSLTNKVVLITGGARGIGAATAQAIVAAGGKVILTDVDQEPLDKLAAELGSEAALGIVADVTDLPSMEAAVAAGVAKFGGIDVALANAGIATYGSVQNVDPAAFRRLIDININGVFHTVRAALPSLIERKGYILVVSSLAAFAPAPGLAPYNASKAGVEHFANALRLEVHHQGVDVGVAHMSWIDTPLVQDAKSDLKSFGQLIEGLPTPLNKTTSVEACVKAFVKGIETRKRRVYCPSWVGMIRARRNLIASSIGDRTTLKRVPTLLPQMDEEVRRLGRSSSARNKV
ncbi:SDR family oxidoreductase [Nocardioides marmorisolisilvae]|uniref:SDR family oxidoreductase n=1 Tax=Nocardioides marmorisolisilvae TaxID=1542737 RepID=A0A3N0DV67_9ACTN|nr:SDR family oxidoreductase [Nocardioides marmorisolisilvae]RNL79376.1 SDR family oxidoreductase [Nocardioides marmorisolisilvae]